MTKPNWPLVAFVTSFSGFYGLVYQVVWDRVLRFNFGGDSVSSAIVTSSFLLGLGLGALVFGRSRARPARTLGFVEIGIGLFALASFRYLGYLSTNLGAMLGAGIDDISGLRTGVILGSILFIVPPSILMGGTLPLFLDCFIGRGGFRARSVGLVYSLNTIGAAAGVIGAVFLFLNHFDIPTTLLVVGTAQILFGIWLVTRLGDLQVEVEDDHDSAIERSDPRRKRFSLGWVLLLGFASGAIVLGVETQLFRHFGTFNPSSPYNFPFVLVVYLLGLAAGSAALTRLSSQSVEAVLTRIGVLFLASQVALIVAVWIGSGSALSHELSVAAQVQYWLGVTLLVPFFAGGVFPLLLRLAAQKGLALPRRTGQVYLASSIGAFVGGLTIQFIGFPRLGTRGVLLTIFYLGVACGAGCLFRACRDRRASVVTATVVLLVAAIPELLPSSAWHQYTFKAGALDVIAVEGVSGVATIAFNADRTGASVRVNGQRMSSLPHHPKHVRLESFALSLPSRERLLVLGLGGGGMVRALREDQGVQSVTVVDWSHELAAALADPAARRLLDGALQESDVTTYVADARVAIGLFPDDSFDVVVDNLAIGTWVGATTIKSKQFYSEIGRILVPNGVFVYDINRSSSLQEAQNLAAIGTSFRAVYRHAADVVLASNEALVLETDRVEHVLTSRAKVLGLHEAPYSPWMLDGLVRIPRSELESHEPIRDELLIHEYQWHPLCFGLGHGALGFWGL